VNILHPDFGLLNTALAWLGIKGPAWLVDPRWAKPALILMSLWGAGGSMVIYLAGLQGVPQHLYEAAAVMQTPDGVEPPIFREFRALLPANMEFTPLDRFEFYDAARGPHLALVIATGDQRLYANILLTIGVRSD
jgi:hypothetical protein